ncbi:sensor histidine kinase [Stagnimonas aquatica]|uniref:histidine kinase n=1 Tax=Stagnimonas aquatica TaxID=2689987 RepID=A0A3N0VJY8_9GAMM|nr:sensor histidine kinase [Stagnimonas aquatica]
MASVLSSGRTGGHRLRRRLASSLVSLSLLSALLLGLGFLAVERYIEHATLSDLLEREMRYFVRAGTAPEPSELQGETLRYYRPARGGAPPPAVVWALPPGLHADIVYEDRPHYVLVRRLGPGDSAYLSYSDRALSSREQLLWLTLLAGMGFTALLGWWLSGRLAQQTLAPLDGLVADLRGLDPEQRGARLPAAPHDSELAVIAEALNGHMARVDELVERERAFAASASHELRTPLAVILGAAEILDASQPAPPVARILRSARSALQDLDALLWLSRTDVVPVAEALPLHERLPALCAAQLDISAVDWQLQPCTVVAPAGAVTVIVSNLLRNSLRAVTQAGRQQPGAVRVRLDSVGLVVDDDGPGIPPEELPQVFAPRSRGRDGGTGMGLYIAATLAQRLRWRLSLENRPEGGARARLSF